MKYKEKYIFDEMYLIIFFHLSLKVIKLLLNDLFLRIAYTQSYLVRLLVCKSTFIVLDILDIHYQSVNSASRIHSKPFVEFGI